MCFSWLKGLGLSAYTDNFHNQSIYYMYQIQGFGLEVSYVGFAKLCGVWSVMWGLVSYVGFGQLSGVWDVIRVLWVPSQAVENRDIKGMLLGSGIIIHSDSHSLVIEMICESYVETGYIPALPYRYNI